MKFNVKFIWLSAMMAALPIFVIFPQATGAQTEEECENAVLTVIARDPSGEFIPGISLEVFEQIEDADGSAKPGKRMGGGTISAITGLAEMKFKPEAGRYVLHMWHKNKSVGDFWFYDRINLSCGEEETVTEKLSAIRASFRTAEGKLLKNKQFSVYSQNYDADNNPIKEKKDLVAALNTGEIGETVIFVRAGARAINEDGGDYYLVETAGEQGSAFSIFDIRAVDGSMTNLDYVFSDAKLQIMNSEQKPFPAGTKLEIFQQNEGAGGVKLFGDHIKDLLTDEWGIVFFEYPAGMYAARIKGADGTYQNFWDIEIIDQERSEYTLSADGTWKPDQNLCQDASTLTVIPRTIEGGFIAGLHFELYEQVINADGFRAAGKMVLSGMSDAEGRAKGSFKPNPLKKYALKLYDKNKSQGDFWFFDDFAFICGQNLELSKNLPALKVSFRDGQGNLLKNRKFSIYTQDLDQDGIPIRKKKDLAASGLDTGETGQAVIYLAPDHPFIWNKKGVYVLETEGSERAIFSEYDLKISQDKDLNLIYVLSDLLITLKRADNIILKDASLELYEQKMNAFGEYVLGERLSAVKTDSHAQTRLQYPAGTYALAVKDDLGQNNIFWHTIIENRSSLPRILTVNATRVAVLDSAGKPYAKDISLNIYALKDSGGNKFTRDKKIKTVKIPARQVLVLSLAPNPYLLAVSDKKNEYAKPIYAENGKIQSVQIKMQAGDISTAAKIYPLTPPPKPKSLAEKLAGLILLQVEAKGEAWYVDPKTLKRYYLKDGAAAFEILRKFGLGIKNSDIRRIPAGRNDKFEENDYDGDYVPDKMEEALGIDYRNRDSDGDTFLDGRELFGGYDPAGPGKLPLDFKFSERQKGKILLQTESKGQAWYVYPKDGARYYLKDGDSAFQIMKFLGLGITNANLRQIKEGGL